MKTDSGALTPRDTPAEEVTQPFFGIARIFLKGVSMELPLGAYAFHQTGSPDMTLNLQVNVEALTEGAFQCVIRATLKAVINEKTLFLLEVEQAGVFETRELTPEQQADMQEIAAPTILAPYLRAQIADVLTRTTLPSYYLPEINWAEIARQSRFARAAQAPAATVPASPVLH